MKKLTAVLFTLFFASMVHADFKVLGGLNLSSYMGYEDTIWKLKMGLVGGIGLELDLTYRTLVEVDILFFQKGGQTGPSIREERYTMSTVSFPVLLRSKLFHGTSPYIIGGIEFSGILAYSKKSAEEEPVDMAGTLQRFDYGFVIGGGFDMELSDDLFLFIEARYHWGAKNLLVDPVPGQVRKTTAFVLLIGVRS